MRTLLYVPIIHMDVDMGSLASDVAKRGIRGLGEEVWKKHVDTVVGFWNSLFGYFDALEVSNFKVYQDGLVADGDIGQKIVEEGLKNGSKNYEIVYKLIQRGAVLMKTEDFLLVKEERDRFLKIIRSKTRIEKVVAYLRYKLFKNRLLKKRDRFIGNRINETLNQGETGILFIGAYHNIILLLDRDIHVREKKEIEKVREYQEALLHSKSNTKRFEELSEYLLSPPSSV